MSADGLASLAGGRRRRSPMRRGMPEQGFARLPGRGDAGRTELAERLLASQQKFAQDVPRATTPLLPGTGGTGAKNSGGQTRQASPSRRACRYLRRVHCPAASRSRFAADLLIILGRERKRGITERR